MKTAKEFLEVIEKSALDGKNSVDMWRAIGYGIKIIFGTNSCWEFRSNAKVLIEMVYSFRRELEDDIYEGILFDEMEQYGCYKNLKDYDDAFVNIWIWDTMRKKKICVDAKFDILDINGIEIL